MNLFAASLPIIEDTRLEFRSEPWLALWWPYLLGTLLLLSLIAYLLVRKWRHQQELRNQPVPPSVRALVLLKEAHAKWSEEGVNWYVFEATRILRAYLEEAFGSAAPYLSTQEFLAQMSELPTLNEAQVDWLRNFLPRCDLVKFAAQRLIADEVERFHAECCAFVNETNRVAETESTTAGAAT